MYIDNILIKNFRNYSKAELFFTSGINFIIGPNATGKTNILEAISITSNIRSFRGVSDNKIIKWGENSYYCCSKVLNSDYTMFEVGCEIESSRLKKRASIDGNHIKSSSEFYGKLLTIILSPDDIYIIKGTPDIRRKYFDGLISKIDKIYFRCLNDFKKILSSRNSVLKKIRESKSNDYNELEVWDAVFAEKASIILEKRRKFLYTFNNYYNDIYLKISNYDDSPKIEYYSLIESFDEDNIKKELLNRRKRDIITCSTSIGPQRDDYLFLNINDINLKHYASQGQNRTASIALKIAEYNYIEGESGKRSVILIDDIFSELDKNRRENFVNIIMNKNQVIITMVNNSLINYNDFFNNKVFLVEQNGVIKEA
ncbi:MAG: DNA replication and repair protein RecF [Spirochaetota bacterium]|nr:DNA replication and repair protein RecF [Spirochaetota bacterium]